MRYLGTIGIACALLSSACSDSLTRREQVVDLRLLGVRLDPPSAAPGEAVTASALIVDLLEQGYTQTWYACLAPSSLDSYLEKSPDRSDCPVGDTPHGTEIGTGAEASFAVPEAFFEVLEESAKAEGIDVDPETLGYLAAVTGWHLRVTLIVEGPGKRIEAQKRLLVMLSSGENENPAPPTLVVEEVVGADEPGFSPASLIREVEPAPEGACLSPESPATALTKNVYRLTPVNLPDPPPTYTAINFATGLEEREETIFYSWFSTVPGLSRPVSQSPEEHPNSMVIGEVPPELLVDGEVPIWIVARDGRGGTTWCHDTLPYTPPP